jgi:hypothetical protein
VNREIGDKEIFKKNEEKRERKEGKQGKGKGDEGEEICCLIVRRKEKRNYRGNKWGIKERGEPTGTDEQTYQLFCTHKIDIYKHRDFGLKRSWDVKMGSHSLEY